MNELSKNQKLKKLYDYGDHMTPQKWAQAVDMLLDGAGGGSSSQPEQDPIQTSHDKLVNLINTNQLVPNQWYEFEHNPYIPQLDLSPTTKTSKVRVRALTSNSLYEDAFYYGVCEYRQGMDYKEQYITWRPCKYKLYNGPYIKTGEDLYAAYNPYDIKWFVDNEDKIKEAIVAEIGSVSNIECLYIASDLIYTQENDIYKQHIVICRITELDETVYFEAYKFDDWNDDSDIYATPQDFIYSPLDDTGFVYDIKLQPGFLSYDITHDRCIVSAPFTFISNNVINYINLSNHNPYISHVEIINSTLIGDIQYYPNSDGEIDDIEDYPCFADRIIDSHIESNIYISGRNYTNTHSGRNVKPDYSIIKNIHAILDSTWIFDSDTDEDREVYSTFNYVKSNDHSEIPVVFDMKDTIIVSDDMSASYTTMDNLYSYIPKN